MFVWELVSCRLRVEGWNLWHTTSEDAYGPTYHVHVERRGIEYEVSGPTLTEAYAAAARRAREYGSAEPAQGAGARRPGFARLAAPILAGL